MLTVRGSVSGLMGRFFQCGVREAVNEDGTFGLEVVYLRNPGLFNQDMSMGSCSGCAVGPSGVNGTISIHDAMNIPFGNKGILSSLVQWAKHDWEFTT